VPSCLTFIILFHWLDVPFWWFQVIRSIQLAALLWSNNKQQSQNLVAISGSPDTSAFIDNLLDSYQRALRDSGYTFHVLPSNGNLKKTLEPSAEAPSFTSEDRYVAVFCLRGRCGNIPKSSEVPLKVNLNFMKKYHIHESKHIHI
jgi:hypothetical protein